MKTNTQSFGKRMRSSFLVLFLLPLILLAFTSVSHSAYEITQITNNAYWDDSPRINDGGQVVWVEFDGDSEIFFYDGVSITQLTNNAHDDYYPQINNKGEVVWVAFDGSDSEIFLYDGVSVTQITDNADAQDPQINDNGEVVWQEYVGAGSDWEIFLYDGASITQLTDNTYDDYDPQMNNNGEVVWMANDFSDWEIFLYDGVSIIQLTDNAYTDQDPRINDNGQVVWEGFDGSDYEIFLYDGVSVTQITNNAYHDIDPQINDNGEVAWVQFDVDYEIFFYDGVSTTQITNNAFDDQDPQINNNGEVVWWGDVVEPGAEIFFAQEEGLVQQSEETFLDPAQAGIEDALVPAVQNIPVEGELFEMYCPTGVLRAEADAMVSLEDALFDAASFDESGLLLEIEGGAQNLVVNGELRIIADSCYGETFDIDVSSEINTLEEMNLDFGFYAFLNTTTDKIVLERVSGGVDIGDIEILADLHVLQEAAEDLVSSSLGQYLSHSLLDEGVLEDTGDGGAVHDTVEDIMDARFLPHVCGCVTVTARTPDAGHIALNMGLYLLPLGLIFGLKRRISRS